LSGVKFPGHTEMLQALAAQHLNKTIAQLPVRMMLANRELKTVLVTIHQPLRQAIDAITVDNILETLRITHRAELAFTGRAPHLAVAGLNPHAGEGGLLGREEMDIIQPAIQLAKAEGMHASGPWSPDTVFMRARAERGQPGAIDVVVRNSMSDTPVDASKRTWLIASTCAGASRWRSSSCALRQHVPAI
jgi:4-hydroxythreonine-4-phosphate dehydrogenase